ncbi:ribosomal protein S18-alanine N-acetyltransferase [Calidifontimicrobium sp. SYSU G02091]|uniref:ribosomal protein S18-alanine N-acetyltransferase n=1 Tax=Calidifontimicrobium sp. SYSU G02091 TaxID=2926421 RepID=UPI001F52DA4C|nr:ribosomal protein S18-alanine N-acetyltransferase [Calidifontimicrobium sp. SYSU G02091]MCI1190659.1 ribosomal protein S18-alanine N-acetyltransferase [Calidifontimicrobium sp. SYSU G02091]
MSSRSSSERAVAAAHLAPMTLDDVDAVYALEVSAYSFPWTRGNFVDSLVAGHLAEVLRAGDGEVIGYFVALPGADEMHLLNLAVAPAHQRRGHARRLLDELVARSVARGARSLWLEVRESNAPAQALYRRYGFVPVGRRRGYYPAAHGRREDAVLMSLDLAPWADGRGHGMD